MTIATDSENWRKKYFDSLAVLEREQQQFGAMGAVLKRLIGRLCTAALGLSPPLDEQLRRLQTAIRRDVSAEDLEKLTPAITQAIQALGLPIAATVAQQPASPPSDPSREIIFNDEQLRSLLVTLLAELRRDAGLTAQIEALDTKLGAALTNAQLPEVLGSLLDLASQRIRRVETAKQEIETLLGDMVGKLDEIGRFVAEQNQQHSRAQASSDTLNTQLAVEIKAMGETVDAASDLQQIREQVRSRLDSIERHLQEFRQREAPIAASIRTGNDQMRSRILELEAEAKRLHHQLRDEQRLSTIDALTRVPNRLAYQKRIEEELQRLRRFRQPTCLAVWDVDHFKRINDSYGHRAGDRVLRAVADCFASQIRGTDFVARYGGEEFVMILPGTDLADATRFNERIRGAVAAIGFHFRGTPISITVSSGMTALLADDSSGSAFDRADKALYRAKEAGRNRCVTA